MTALLVLLTTSLSVTAPASPYPLLDNSSVFTDSMDPQVVPPANHISGPQSVIVILVRFKDVANTRTRDEVKDLVFTRLNDYIKAVSYGSAWLTGDVTSQWHQLSRSMLYYGGGSASSERFQDLIVDAVRAADRDVNFMNYEYIMIVHAGDNQDKSLHSNDVTSWGVYGNGYPVTTGEGTLGFGVSVLAEMDPLGPFAHYLARNFRLPDLWNHGGNPLADDFVAEWDLMGHGFWANNGSTPVEPTSWCRIRLGWMTEFGLVEVNATESRTLEIDPLETLTGGTKAVKVPISKHTYYLIEVRRRIGYDSYLPDEGVLILYVDEMLGDGGGIVRVVDSTPFTGTLNDAPFKVGGIFQNRTGTIAVEVLSFSNSSYKVLVDRTGQPLVAYLTVNVPFSDIQVRVDGANLTSDTRNRVQKLLRVGEHTVEVQNIVYLSEASRVIFDGWSDGVLSNPRTLAVSQNSTLTANYRLQNLLEVISPYGSPIGSGWYDASAVVTFSVPEVVDQGNGTRRVFMSWTGDIAAPSSTSQIEMSQPRVVIADWETQYAIRFTSRGLKNGTTVTVTINGENETYTVPFNHLEWFAEGSKISFQIFPESAASGVTTYQLEGWTGEDGKDISSPLAVTQPDEITAVYSSNSVFEIRSSDTISDVTLKFWKICLKITLEVLNSLSRYPKLLAVLVAAAYPYFLIVEFAQKLHLTFSFVSAVSAPGSVIVGGILFGLIYLFPISIVSLGMYRWRRKQLPKMRMLFPVVALWFLGIALAAVGAVATIPEIEAISLTGFGTLALATALLSALIPSIKILGLTMPRKLEPRPKAIGEQLRLKENEEKNDKK